MPHGLHTDEAETSDNRILILQKDAEKLTQKSLIILKISKKGLKFLERIIRKDDMENLTFTGHL